jgi:hypothetical protein
MIHIEQSIFSLFEVLLRISRHVTKAFYGFATRYKQFVAQKGGNIDWLKCFA